MTKAVIFDNIYDARQFNADKSYELAGFTGSKTKYKFSMKPMNETTTLTKAEYAAAEGISEFIEGEDGQEANPAYTALSDQYTMHKYAVVVHDALIVRAYDEETGELVSETEPDYVVAITLPELTGQ